MSTPPSLPEVHAFWNTEPCGTHFVPPAADPCEFYERLRTYRDATEWHLPELVPFAETKGCRLLEIGTGHGADGARFAQHGAVYTGVDLTEAAIDSARRHFACLGLAGTFQKENAEALSFTDASFDWVYSHGVLHHTPDPQQAVREVHRVLKPGGRAVVMLYHRRSFNYLVRIQGYLRARVLLKILSRIGRWASDRQKIHPPEGVRGNAHPRVWDLHYRNFLSHGWRYLRARNFAHHATDGPECPVAHAFSRAEAAALFSQFASVRMEVAHLPISRYWSWFPRPLERPLARWLGWYLFLFVQKNTP